MRARTPLESSLPAERLSPANDPDVIPQRYDHGMTVQMTVRIPDVLADFVDEEVANGARSRAEVIARALRRELRRKQAERDAAIYAAASDPDDLEGLARWSSKQAGGLWRDRD